jgi:hypothetical protein
MQSLGIPLFNTTWELTRYLPFVILEVLSLFTTKHALGFENYKPKWRNYTIVISYFMVNDSQESTFPIVKNMTPNGFTINWSHLSNSIFDNTVTIKIAAPREVRTLTGNAKFI